MCQAKLSVFLTNLPDCHKSTDCGPNLESFAHDASPACMGKTLSGLVREGAAGYQTPLTCWQFRWHALASYLGPTACYRFVCTAAGKNNRASVPIYPCNFWSPEVPHQPRTTVISKDWARLKVNDCHRFVLAASMKIGCA